MPLTMPGNADPGQGGMAFAEVPLVRPAVVPGPGWPHAFLATLLLTWNVVRAVPRGR
jgi:hypothetical protein